MISFLCFGFRFGLGGVKRGREAFFGVFQFRNGLERTGVGEMVSLVCIRLVGLVVMVRCDVDRWIMGYGVRCVQQNKSINYV